ncbi:MAG: ABC transporter permease [Magnetospirillum sp.]|nr:ABC transporter permease [Magnetospirillum sp.]
MAYALSVQSVRDALRGAPVIPIGIIATLIVVGFLAPVISPHDPNTVRLMNSHLPPVFLGGTFEHILGTDDLGRDVLSRLISGARISLLVGFAVVVGAGSIGTFLALLSGYFGGVIDNLISRMCEVFIAVPFLLVAIAVVGAVGASTQNLILTLIFMSWAGYARVLRSEVLRLREMEFVKLAKVAGCSNTRILFRHLLPNIINPLVILATLQLGATIVVEASLSFLGLGVPPPQATWGGMLASGKNFIGFQTSLVAVPGIAIFLVVMSINILGDWLRVRLDPRFRQL